LIHKRDRSYKRKKKSGNKADKNKYKKLKHETQRQLRKAYWQYVEGIVTPEVDDRAGNGNCMKQFWTYIKHKRSDSNTIPPLKTDGILHPDSKDKANILNKQFQMTFSTKTEVSDESFKNTCNMKGKFETMHDIQITEEGVTKLLKNLNPHKVPGPDNIFPRPSKELATHISPILTIIFRKSYNTGEIPSIWKRAFVCPIFKKGKKFEAINYRPVSPTCIACKLMEHIITCNIMAHADKHRILHPLQHGFRKGLSCDTQLVEFVDNVTKKP
jgi:hypothetical protein